MLEILKNEAIGEREGRDGRIRTGKCIEWFVVEGADLIGTFRTRRMAKAFVAGEEEIKRKAEG